MTTVETSAADVLDVLARGRYTYTDEVALHVDLSRVLTAHGLEHEREVRLSDRDRIDFMVGRVGVEVKVAGTLAAVQRQMTRYATHDVVDELVLVTTRAVHTALPRTLGGKRAVVFNLGAHQAF